MYVDLNCSWFRHPFPRRSFKLTSQSQITTIKGLGLGTVLVYPERIRPRDGWEAAPIESAADPASAPESAAEPSHEEATAEPAPLVEQEMPTQGDYHQAAQMASKPIVRCSETVRRS